MNNEFFAGLDIGSDSIKLVVLTRVSNGTLAIVGMTQIPTNGVKKGVITDIEELTKSIQKAVEDIYNKAGIRVTSVIASVPATMIESINITGIINIQADENNERRVDQNDIVEVTKNAITSRAVSADRQIVDIVIDQFVIDQFGNIDSPIGMIGATLEMHATAYTGPKMIIDGLRTATKNAGLQIEQLSLTPLAIKETVLTDAQKKGSFLINFGADQTTLTVFVDGKIDFITSVPQGGNQVTNDIVYVLNDTFKDLGIDFEKAENIKTSEGIADPLTINEDKIIKVVSGIDNQPKEISIKFVSEIIEARVQETIEKLYESLAEAYKGKIPDYEIIITGGASALNGLNDLVAQLFGRKSTLYVPSEIGARQPGWTTSISITHLFAEEKSTERAIKATLNNVNLNSMNANASQSFGESNDNGNSIFKRHQKNDGEKTNIIDKLRDFLGKITE